MSINVVIRLVRSLIFAVLSVVLVGCGQGSGPQPIAGTPQEPAPDPDELVLVFSDEFDTGTMPSPEKWTLETGYGPNNDGWGNNEWQLYTTDPENVRVEGGNLVISAQCATPPCGSRDGSITSARLNTLNKFNFRFGKIVARIQPPVGAGAWPAFWALGINHPQVGWPRSGEIDFMEMFNTGSDNRTTHSTLHWCDETLQAPATCSFPEGRVFDTGRLQTASSLGDDFHIWEAEWDASGFSFSIDGTVYFTRTIDIPTMDEFLEEFYMILNVAMGGTLGSNNQPPSGSEVFPQTMLVDYIRVFQNPNDTGGPGVPVEGAVEFPLDFEADAQIYSFNDFEGGAAAVILNPVMDANNTSAQVARMLKFSGADFAGSRLDLTTPLAVEMGTTFTMNVWSPRPVMVLFKLEGANTIELNVPHTGTGWEELTYDFTSFNGNVEGVTVIFDIGIVGDATGDPDNWTFYVDDIELAEAELDTTAPTLTAVSVASNNSNVMFSAPGDRVTVTLSADEPIAEPQVTIGGIVADSVIGSDISWQASRVLTTDDAEGAITISIAYSDLSGNVGLVVDQSLDDSSVTFDATAPSVVIQGLSATANTTDAQTLTFQFDESVTGFELSDISITNGVANDFAMVDQATYTANVTPQGEGEVIVAVAAGAAMDVAGNQSTMAADATLLVDTIAPMLVIVGAPANANSLDPITMTFQFSEAVTDFDITDIQISNGAASEFSIVSAASYTANITPMGDGDLTVNVAAGVAQDAVGNLNTLAAVSTVLIDSTAPTLTILGVPADFATLAPISVTFQFSEDVIGFDVSDVIVTNGVADIVLMVDAATYTAEVTPDGNGDLTISVAAGAAQDGIGNSSVVAADVTALIDAIAPTVTIENAPANFTTLAPFGVTIQFSESVSMFEVSDFQITNGAASELVDVDGDTYTANITPNGVGDLTVSIAAGAAQDGVGNPSAAAVDVTVLNALDTDAPLLTAISISSNNANPAFATVGDMITIVMIANEAILEPVVTIGGAVADTVIGTGTTWQATRILVNTDVDGPVNFAIDFEDLEGNAGPQSTVSTDASSVVFDSTAPVLTLVGLPSTFTTLDPIPTTFQFSEDVTGFDVADINVTGGAAGSFVATSASEYTADITPDGNGNLVVGVAAGAVQDLAGITNLVTADVTVINDVDVGAPTLTVVSISSNNVNTAVAAVGDVISIDVTADEDIAEPTVVISGVAADSVTGAGTTWQASRALLVSDIEGPVSFAIDFEDVGGNVGTQVTATTDATLVTFDRTDPTLAISGLPASFTTLDPIAVTFQFSEDVSGFDAADITVVNGSTTGFAPVDAANYTVNITPEAMGDLMVSVAADSASDAAGNGNSVATESSTSDLQPVWQLVWSDEFDGATLDGTNWTARTDADCPDPCEGEQTYSTANTSVAGGMLTITAQENAGPVYVSGFIDSRGKREFRYGRVEIDAQMPGTLGTLPTLMLLPANDAFGAWPQSGEIDVVNAPDIGVSSNVAVEQSLQYGLPVPENTATTGSYDALTPPDSSVITYAIEWEAGEIRWFVDDVHVLTQSQDNWYSYSEDADGVFMVGVDDAPFNEEFYLALNLAIADSANGTSSFPQTLQIDAVRVFECAFATDPLAGTGCSTGDVAVTPVVAPNAPYEETLDVYTDGFATLDFVDENMMTTSAALAIGAETSDVSVTVMGNVAAVDSEGGTVWNLNIGAATGRADLLVRPGVIPGSTGSIDLSGGGTAGELLFRLRVNSALGAPTLAIGLDGTAAGSGEVSLPYINDGQWRNVSVKIADIVTNSVANATALDLGNIMNVFRLSVEAGSIDLDIDDISVKVACRDMGGCEATPRIVAIPDVLLYSQDFEAMIPDEQVVPNTFSADSWLVGANVFDPTGLTFLYNYFPFPAPNGGPAFSAITSGQGGDTQGANQLVAYNDYNNADHNLSRRIEANVFREFTVTADQVGKVLIYSFDAKRGDINDPASNNCMNTTNPPCDTTASAFIKVLKSSDGSFAELAADAVDTTALPVTWNRYTASITIPDASFVGETLQIGFLSIASNFEPSGVFYDNIEIVVSSTPP